MESINGGRLLYLRRLLAAGRIDGLRLQHRFPLRGPGGTKIASYVADFVYIRDGQRVVEDVKSSMTKKLPVYKLKKAWMLDQYGIAIKEV